MKSMFFLKFLCSSLMIACFEVVLGCNFAKHSIDSMKNDLEILSWNKNIVFWSPPQNHCFLDKHFLVDFKKTSPVLPIQWQTNLRLDWHTSLIEYGTWSRIVEGTLRMTMDKRTKSQPFSLLLMEDSKLYVCKITDLFSLYISAYENAFFRWGVFDNDSQDL